MNKVVWYTLYAFVVGRSYDEYGEPTNYWFYSYVVLPQKECDYEQA
jgi:hypothetical protein